MPEPHDLPRTSPAPLQARFSTLAAARTAIETMLQGGFTGEQLGLIRADDSVLSPANDLATYRSTGMKDSGSEFDLDRPFAADDYEAKAEHEREVAMLREHAVIVTVTLNEGQENNAREMITSLGGRILRADGSMESTEAA